MDYELKSLQTQQGATLLEGLVSILIFALGMLGLIGLLMTSSQRTRDSKYLLEASFVTKELTAMMWADRGKDLANLVCYSVPSTGACPSSPSKSRVDAWLASFTSVGGARYLPGAAAERQQVIVDPVTGMVTLRIRWRTPQDLSEREVVSVAQIQG
jgi:type IV pilus assembly protein PilV